LPEPLRIFSAGLSLVSAWVLSKHLFWARFIRKNADTRLISRRYPNRPARWPLPYAWLGKVGMQNQLHDLEVNEYEVRIPGWPKEFSGFSLAQVSDIHFGGYIHPEYLKFVFAEMRKLKPDLFALTGDFISRARDIPALEKVLKGFKAPLGVYAILGNHDHWTEGSMVMDTIQKAGIRVLKNEVVTFRKKGKTLSLMGVDDLWTGEKNESAFSGNLGDAKIMLAHNPDHFYLSKRVGAHIQISGHCHGGQICFPLLGSVIVPSKMGRNYAGGFFRDGKTVVFINRGIGGFPQVRTLCHPEIVKLTLLSE
jgi:predicted MPP superfamily phosphohydrolase